MNRRYFLGVSAAMVCLGAPKAFAQTANAGPMTLIVPYPAGGASDVFARTLSPALGRELGRTIVVENVSGASGSLGVARAVSANPVGDTLLMASPTDVILAPSLLKSTRYQAEDLALIGLVDTAPLTVFVRAELPVNSIDELIAYAKRPKTAPLSYGTTGTGSFYHLVAESFQRAAGIELMHVPYRGAAPILQDLVAGNIDLTLFPATQTIGSMAQSGRLKAIGIMGAQRGSRLPDVRTFAESQSMAAFKAPDVWAGLMVSAAAPVQTQERLHAALAQVLSQPEVRRTLGEAAAGSVPPTISLTDAAAFYDDQIRSLRHELKAAAIDPA